MQMKVVLIFVMIGVSIGNCNEASRERSAPSYYQDFGQTRMGYGDAQRGCGNNGQGQNCGMQAGGADPMMRASNIAQQAAQEAKAASDAQNSAGAAASQQVKTQLAEKALAAAKAAEAALAGKQQIVGQLEQEVREAEAVVQEENSSLQHAQRNVQAAFQAAQQAAMQCKTLKTALLTAQSNVANSEEAAQGAQQEMSEKMQLLEAAKHRVEQLLRQLSCARTDFANTKHAAYKAACAAHEAKINACRNRRMSLKSRIRSGSQSKH